MHTLSLHDALPIFSVPGKIENIDSLKLDTSAGISVSEGEIAWNSSDGTIDIGLAYGDVVLQVGQETHYVVRNATGNTILNGTAVYCSGVTVGSGRIEIDKMESTIDPVQFLGLATQDINNGVNGVVTHFGYVRGLDTRGSVVSSIAVGDEDWQVGDKLYVHPTAPGKLTNVEPEAPNVKICVASVINRNQTAGVLFVRPTTNLTLSKLSDVHVDSPTDGQLLQYVSANTRWENTSDITANSITVTTDENATFTSSSGYGQIRGDNGAELYHESGNITASISIGGDPAGAGIQVIDLTPGSSTQTLLEMDTESFTLSASHSVYLRTNYGPNVRNFAFTDYGLIKSPVMTWIEIYDLAEVGQRAFISDADLEATAANFGEIVGGGGANVAPVWSDGFNWRIG
jgi:hypothetical protein